MNIKSLSVIVPNKVRINHRASCLSRMHDNNYELLFDENRPDFDLQLKEYLKRLEFASDNGYNTLMLTGSEPQQNRRFLILFGMMMQMIKAPFKNIEMQCTGALLNKNYIEFLRRHVGITLMGLSVFALNSKTNREIINPPKNVDIDIIKIADQIKAAGISLRMYLNLTKHFDIFANNPSYLFDIMKKDFNADQVTLRVLCAGKDNKPENVWMNENTANSDTIISLRAYIKAYGTILGKTPYGDTKYSVNGMSVVMDDNCTGKKSEDAENCNHLILSPDCKLYSSWDNTASLIF